MGAGLLHPLLARPDGQHAQRATLRVADRPGPPRPGSPRLCRVAPPRATNLARRGSPQRRLRRHLMTVSGPLHERTAKLTANRLLFDFANDVGGPLHNRFGNLKGSSVLVFGHRLERPWIACRHSVVIQVGGTPDPRAEGLPGRISQRQEVPKVVRLRILNAARDQNRLYRFFGCLLNIEAQIFPERLRRLVRPGQGEIAPRPHHPIASHVPGATLRRRRLSSLPVERADRSARLFPCGALCLPALRR